MSRRLPALVALLVVALSSCVLFWPLVHGWLGGEPRFLEWDVPEQYWPDLVYLCGALHEGELPLWNPFDRAGYPFYADPQAAAYHPLSWVMCAAGGPSPSLAWAEARVVFGFFVAGAFGLLWLRRYRLGWGAALLGAVAMQWAPFMRHNFELNLTGGLAYLPLVLWAADRAVTERRGRDAALLALALALCAWSGSPPALWLSITFAAPFTLYRLAEEARGRPRQVLPSAALVLGGASALAAALVAAVVLPGLTLARHSVQAGRGYESIAAGGLELDHLGALLLPRSGNHLYVGLLVALLAFVAVAEPALRRAMALPEGSRRRPARWMLAIMAVLAVGLALGDNGPLFRLAFDLVPGVSTFRLPHRYEAWLGPAMGALAAFGLESLSGPRVRAWLGERRRAVVRVAVVLGLTAGATWAYGLPLGLTLALVGAAAVLFAVRAGLGASHVAVGALLALLLLVDLSQTLPPDRHTRAGTPPGQPAAAASILALAPDTESQHRYMDEFGVSCRSGTRFGRRDLRGYQDPLLLRAYERVVASLGDHPGLLEQLGVRYVLTGPHFIHGSRRHYLPPPGELLAMEGGRDLGHGVIELPAPLPPAYLVPRCDVEGAPDRPAALRRLLEVAPAPVAILDGASTGSGPPAPPRCSAAGAGGASSASDLVAARSFRLGRDRVELSLDAPEPGLVVVGESWYPGWQATVDGEPARVLRVNALVRGVFVDRGDHDVVMRFRPADGAPLRWLLLAALGACLLLVFFGIKER